MMIVLRKYNNPGGFFSPLIALLSFIFVGNASVYGQLPELKTAFSSGAESYLHEKVYLHTDREAYMTGEICWFKAYLLSLNGGRSDVSKVLYVELIDNVRGTAALQAKISLDQGLGNGSLFLPPTLLTGSYRLRAYTNLMKNMGVESFFQKDLLIVNPHQQEPVVTEASVGSKVDAQLFPEGGYLLSGQESKIGFRVRGTNGKGMVFQGTVVDANGDTVARFSPESHGIGSFRMKPDAGMKYKVLIRPQQGAMFSIAFPEVLNAGYSLTLLSASPEKISINVKAVNKSSSTVTLLGHNGSSIKFGATQPLRDMAAEFSIDTKDLVAGVTCFTLFDEGKNPVAERLYFKFPKYDTKLEVKTSSTKFSSRSRVQLELDTHAGEKAISSDLSIAVYHAPANLHISGTDIGAYFLLSSELKGRVEEPEAYVSGEEKQRLSMVDDLMLCSGWNGLNWQELLKVNKGSNNLAYLPEYDGNFISAKLSAVQSGQTAAGVHYYLAVPGKGVQLYTAVSDGTGLLTFNTRGIKGPAELILQPYSSYNNNYRISLLSPFFPGISSTAFVAPSFTVSEINDIRNASINMQVQNAFVAAKLRELEPAEKDSSTFYSKPDKTYLLDDYTRFATTEEVMREYIPEIWLQRRAGVLQLAVVNSQTRMLFSSEPLMMLDGVPFSRSSKILKYDPLKLKAIDIVTSRYFEGVSSFEGVVNFRTYKGNLDGYELDSNATVVDYDGLLEKRTFYSPQYLSTEQRQSSSADFRNLLYWSGDLKTNAAEGKVRVEFYTSDQKGIFIGKVQGLAADGSLLSNSFEINVE